MNIFPPKNNFPKFCAVCGSKLIWNTDDDGFYEDTGEPKFAIWLSCPKYVGGRTMTRSDLDWAYTALRLNRAGTDFEKGFMYTRYQTCDKTIIY